MLRLILPVTALALMLPLAALGQEPAQSAQPESQQLPASTAPPKLTVDQMTLDLGVVEEGGVAEGAFVLKNEGGSLLEIYEAKPG